MRIDLLGVSEVLPVGRCGSPVLADATRRVRGHRGPAGCKDGLGQGPIGIRVDCRNRAHKSYINTRKSKDVFAKVPHARAPSRRELAYVRACTRAACEWATSMWLWATLVNSFFLLLENRNSLIF